MTPAADASMAARRPAPPAPMTRTSCCVRVVIRPSENPPVVPDTHGTKADVQVRKAHDEQAAPRPDHVSPIEAAHAVVGTVRRTAMSTADRDIRPTRCRIEWQPNVYPLSRKTLRARTMVPTPMPNAPARRRIREPHRLPDVDRQDEQKTHAMYRSSGGRSAGSAGTSSRPR